jgi:outer membrane lipase/esterase
MKLSRTFAAASVLLSLWSVPASAVQFDQYVGFGDSSIDSGWWSGALQGQCGTVAGPCTTGNVNKDNRIAAALANGGTSAPVGVGQMNSQILAGMFGLTAKPANQSGGTNYAISGSLTLSSGGFGNLNPNPNLPSTIQQISNYLAQNGGVANPKALYVISTGGNDITYANDNITGLANKENYLAAQIAALSNEISHLQSLGAKNILVHNLYGVGTLANYFNDTLFSTLKNDGVNFVASDVQSLIQQVIANPTKYGFTAATVLRGINGAGTGSACVAGAGSGWGQWCANTTTPGTYSRLRALDSEQTSLFSDDQHLSAAGQLLEAEYDYRLLQATTPLPAAWTMMLLGLAGAGCLRWRRSRKSGQIAA